MAGAARWRKDLLKLLCLLGTITFSSSPICAEPGVHVPADFPMVKIWADCPPVAQRSVVSADQLPATLKRWAGNAGVVYDLNKVTSLRGRLEVYFVPELEYFELEHFGWRCRLYFMSHREQKVSSPRVTEPQHSCRCASDDGIPLGPWCSGDDGIEYAPSCRLYLTSGNEFIDINPRYEPWEYHHDNYASQR